MAKFTDKQKADSIISLFESLNKEDKSKILGILTNSTRNALGWDEIEVEI